MTVLTFSIVLFAAFLHALWNAIVKGGGNTLLMTIIITMMGAIIASVQAINKKAYLCKEALR